MKRYLFLIVLSIVVSTSTALAQKATINKDTVTYGHSKFYPKKEIQILYGSTPSKTFAFLALGSGFGVITYLPASDSKGTVILKKVYSMRGKYYAIGELQNTSGLERKRVTIDIEGAIDNKEIKEDN